ncbi:MAG: GNAT family N-acetyltransferase, partial [Anaerolineae bacterium]|nr:GNAT family N-acetyltransferase [Anaerolineae bacterium]
SVVGPTHFGPMLTSPELRGLGIGSVLLKRCLVDWQKAGHTRCEIIWTGPISFYARAVGATMGSAFWVFYKSLIQ